MSEEIQPHIIEAYKIIKKIGSGAYGHVWKVIDKKTQQTKALKKNFDAFSNSTDAQRTYRQIMFLKQLHHPNIIILEQTLRAKNDKDIYLVFEHMDIDLHTLIRQNTNNEHLQQKHKQFIIYQIAKALHYLHYNNIIHRDLKPSNVLINEQCEAKLCDFGLVRYLDEQEEDFIVMTDYIATRWYRAPELLLGCKTYSKQIDIWALGCLIGQLFRGKAMFAGNSTLNQIEKLLSWTGPPTIQDLKSLSMNFNKSILDLLNTRRKVNKNDFFPTKIPPKCLDLINKTLEFDPEKRIKIQDVLKHEYLSDFYNPTQIMQSCEKKIKIELHINDNTKLSIKNYQNFIYSEIAPRQKISQIKHTQHKFSYKNFTQEAEEKNQNFSYKQAHSKSKNNRLRTLSSEQAQSNFYPQTIYNASQNSKAFPFKECKSSLGKRSDKNNRQSFPRKKGISLCSKELAAQTAYSNKKKYSEPSQLLTKYTQFTSLNNKIKTLSRSNQKPDKSKKIQQFRKPEKKNALTGCFVNDQIGRKDTIKQEVLRTGSHFYK